MGLSDQKIFSIKPIDRPIFIVGCGRSGSTLLYNLLCTHQSLTWFSTYTDRFTFLPIIAFFSRLYPIKLNHYLPVFIKNRIPKPSEGYNLWNKIRPVKDSPSDPPLTETDFNKDDRFRSLRIIKKHQKYHGRTRFLNKNTRNTRRIGYLNALFPDAIFIHIVRDPRASVASLLKAEWWPNLRIWNKSQITPKQWCSEGKDPAILATQLWCDETRLVLDYQKILANRFYRIQYKDLIRYPNMSLHKILDFCELEWNENFIKHTGSFILKNMNYKFMYDLTALQQENIKALTGSILDDMGIVIDDW